MPMPMAVAPMAIAATTLVILFMGRSPILRRHRRSSAGGANATADDPVDEDAQPQRILKTLPCSIQNQRYPRPTLGREQCQYLAINLESAASPTAGNLRNGRVRRRRARDPNQTRADGRARRGDRPARPVRMSADMSPGTEPLPPP